MQLLKHLPVIVSAAHAAGEISIFSAHHPLLSSLVTPKYSFSILLFIHFAEEALIGRENENMAWTRI